MGVTGLLLAAPIRKWSQFSVAFLLLYVLPTGLFLLLDIWDGGLGIPLEPQVVAQRMYTVAASGVVEEILFRGLIIGLPLGAAYLGWIRQEPARAVSFWGVLILSALWVSMHLVRHGAAWYQIIQLVPIAGFYVNLWRGGWWAIAAILVHSIGNVVIEGVWQGIRVLQA